MSEPSKESLRARSLALLSKARAALGKLSLGTRVLLFSGLGLLIVGSVVLAPRFFAEAYAPLFAQLDASDSGAVVLKLKEMKVPYRISEGGGSIEVPDKRVHEVRMELAGSGLPRGGGVGFESFDKMRLGATDFEQRIMYRRALEGELGRTIGNLGAVQSARVHLVMPEKSVFVTKTEPASASIVVKLRSGRTLGASEIAGIVHLTASSTPGLSPDRVTLLSTDGAVLHRPRREGGVGQDFDAEALGQGRALEAALEDRARAMLARIVGAEQVDVRVSAELDLARVERTEDRFDPAHSVLRSEERSTERATPSDSVAGVPGAEANLPTGAAPAAPAAGAPAASGSAAPSPGAAALAAATSGAGAGTVRESHTRNFEVDRVVEKRVFGGGTIKRLTVAVAIGDKVEGGVSVPRSKEELEKIAGLVRGAVGVSAGRGDTLTVESMAFAKGDTLALAEPTAEKLALPKVPAFMKTKAGMIGAGAFGGLVLLYFLVALRRRSKRKANELAERAELAAADLAKARALAAASSDADDAGAGADGGTQGRAGASALLLEGNVDPRVLAQERALRDPATAALVVRAWLGTSEVEERIAS